MGQGLGQEVRMGKGIADDSGQTAGVPDHAQGMSVWWSKVNRASKLANKCSRTS